MKLYHYTIGYKVPLILRDGFIALSPKKPNPGERPVVWLSVNAEYEQTARKSVVNPSTGLTEALRQQETHNLGGGLYRFVFESDHLPCEVMPWIKLKNQARMKERLVKLLLKRAKGVGAKPSEWYGTLETLPVADVLIEHWVPSSNQWVPADLNALPSTPDNVSFRATSVTGEKADERTWKA